MITRRKLLIGATVGSVLASCSKTSVQQPDQGFRLPPMVDYNDCEELWATDMLTRDDGLDKTNTIQPFEQGDIFLSCTYLNHPVDDHAGPGRILQYDQNFKYKGVLWTKGTNSVLCGLEYGKDNLLWAFDPQAQNVVHVNQKGEQLPLHDFGGRAFRTVNFGPDGSIYLSEGLHGKRGAPGTCIKRIDELDGALGESKIHQFDKDWNKIHEHSVEYADEFLGFRCITHAVIHPSGEYLTYTTENGKRVMRYDLQKREQMSDLTTTGGTPMDRNWYIAVEYMSDGRLLVTRGTTMEVLDEKGKILREYDLGPYGWASVSMCGDGQHCLLANVFTGIASKLHIESGKIIASADTGFARPRRSLAGVTEYWVA